MIVTLLIIVCPFCFILVFSIVGVIIFFYNRAALYFYNKKINRLEAKKEKVLK